MQLDAFLEKMTPAIHQALRLSLELGKWPDGRPMTEDERDASLQAVIVYEYEHLPESERVGFMPAKCGNKPSAEDASVAEEPSFVLKTEFRILLIKSITVSESTITGLLSKMHSELLLVSEESGSDHSPGNQVAYQLPVGDQLLPLNELLGHRLSMQYQGEIHCCHCGRKTKKSFSQGFCYPCFRKLPQCDSCIMSPEKCHYHQGTCRDAAWGEQFCMTDHVVYLANSSGLKVGITRATQIPTRWIDQGASQAMPFIRVATRQQSGLLEVIFKEFINDRTNWRAMLKGPAAPLNLQEHALELLDMNASRIAAMQEQFGLQAIQPLLGSLSGESDMPKVLEFDYPVLEYPAKVTSQSFDKQPLIEGTLQGIKGQYLILDTGVVNIRKHTAYQVNVTVP